MRHGKASTFPSKVREGEEVVVTDHGKAVVRIVPHDGPGLLERLVAERVVKPPPDRQRIPPSRRITPAAPASPSRIEDGR